ncbi:ThiF family adenylyltransferase [Cohnella panacarvi]|uniref:ThiF family adenylyltransferase n=1 Tax=Cohnella panacarvi TaxID=400776 RepID=UPI00047E5AEE|nr:ThiF family adenylyltransferase [Cohnella panacarvi]
MRHDRLVTERYSRQIRFAPIGQAGQRKLGDAGVLVVGAGALGASLAQHMVRSGAGFVRLVDRDYVELSNLHRQTLFDEEDARAALPKAVAAAAKLRRMNGGARIEALVADVGKRNAESLLMGVDLVLDGTDNAETRLLMSDACFAHGVPFVYGGVAGSSGMSAMLVPGKHVCLRCLLGETEASDTDGGAPTCDTIGVIAPAVELIAGLQAVEAIKWLTGNFHALRDTWVSADVWNFALKEWKLPPPRESCVHCGAGRLPERLHEAVGKPHAPSADWQVEEREPQPDEEKVVVLCGRDTVQLALRPALGLPEWEKRLSSRGCEITASNAYLIRALTAEGERIVVFSDGRSLIQGAGGVERAEEIYRSYLAEEEVPR